MVINGDELFLFMEFEIGSILVQKLNSNNFVRITCITV